MYGWSRFVSMQPHYNLIYCEEEREMRPLCQDQKIGVIPWSPLACGPLTGKRVRDGGETTRARPMLSVSVSTLGRRISRSRSA